MGWKDWVMVVLAVAGFLFAYYRWVVARNDRRHEAHASAQDRQLREHNERLDRHSERLSKMEELIAATRDELHQNYLRAERIERMEVSIDAKLEKLDKRMTALARDLNQAVGTLHARHESQITALVAEIKEALK